MQTAYLIIIGDEILNGFTLDSNSNYLAYHLNAAGLNVIAIKVINDEHMAIRNTFREAVREADLVISTGGLGPTRDDITKATLAEIFNCKITYNEQAHGFVEAYVQQRNRTLDERNKAHAYIPDKAIPLQNRQGMAPGLLFREDGCIAIALPGVPSEMQELTTQEVIPYLKKMGGLPATPHKHFLTVGIRELLLYERINELEAQLPANISLAYLPSWGMVKLRLTGRGYSADTFQEAIRPFSAELHARAGEYIYGYDDQSLAGNTGKLLEQQQATLATAESCTGGYLAHMITSVQGSSAYFQGSVIAYADAVKMQELGVPAETLRIHGAVSEAVVIAMVKGAVKRLQTDYAIATSGVAGPGGGTREKPVGTVWIAVGRQEAVETHCFRFFRERFKNTYLSAIMGLDMLRRLLTFGTARYSEER